MRDSGSKDHASTRPQTGAPRQEAQPASEITRLLQAMQAREHGAADQLLPLVYNELHRLAVSYVRNERPGHLLQPTALIHEAYIRLVNQEVPWQNRAHFYGIAAQVMRRVLVDHARSENAIKRGREHRKVPLNDALHTAAVDANPFNELDEALSRLEKDHPKVASVVELKFFGGLTVEEMAEFLGVTTRTIERRWSFGQAWLRQKLQDFGAP